MSTDLHDRTRSPSPAEGPEPPEKPKSSFSVAQVIGGALAAMTAAALGSRLSVAGTVIGAAFASVIAAVAGSIYTASLRRTSKHVSAVLTRVRPTPGAPPASSDAASTTTPTITQTTVDEGAAGWVLPSQPDAAAAGTTPAPTRGPAISWKKVVVGAALMFVIAALALTGIELATGHALSGGTGTTVGQVADPGTRPSSTPTHHASATPSATPSDSPSAEPSTSASATPSSEPTAEPSTSATAAPSTTPTPTPSTSAVPSATPTALGAPSGATPAS
jgi:hypothetical protein